MNSDDMKRRTKAFALQAIRFVKALPKDDAAWLMGKQYLRAGTSVGANYRAACRARSTADMIAKLKVVEEEIDESSYWLELFDESGYQDTDIKPLLKESNELLSIVVATIKTLRRRPSDESGHFP